MNQRNLSEWTAGMFDGDGTIHSRVTTSESTNTGYRIDAACSLTNSYVAGLFDAEGTVSNVVAQRGNSAVNHHIDPRCRITQTENDSLIEQLKAFCKSIGVQPNVYHNEQKDNENYAPTFQFDITGKDDVRTFLKSLETDLVVKRKQAEIMLGDILPLLESNAHGTRRGFLRVMSRVDALNSLKGGTRGKYNLEYFEDLWGMEYDPSLYE